MSMNKEIDALNFTKALKFILKREGGYVNDPDDPGGATNFGISLRYALKVGDIDNDGLLELDIDKDGDVDEIDIKNLTPEIVRETYYRDFWKAAGCELLEWPLCLAVFDTAVNSGPDRAKEFLAKSDGTWNDYLLIRVGFYSRIANKKKKLRRFFRGWINRVVLLYAEGKIANSG